MPRVKRGTQHVKKRKKLLKKVKGFKWGRKNLIKQAKEAATKAGAHAYADRKKKKRTTRGLMNIKIGAQAKQQGINYSSLINRLKQKNIIIDRKILADLAVNNKEIFNSIIDQVK